MAINTMDVGMHPLNFCSRLVKEASDVMFSVALNDVVGAQCRLEELEHTIQQLRKSIDKHKD